MTASCPFAELFPLFFISKPAAAGFHGRFGRIVVREDGDDFVSFSI
jgi:hypothetical protein